MAMSNTHRFASRAIFAPSLVYRHLAFALGCAALLLLADKPANAATIQVNMANFKFVPQDIVINAGDTVTWVNQDFTFHDTTSGTNGVRSGLWSSVTFGHGGSFSFTFNVPAGYYGYYCTPHVFTFGMIGSVTVLAPNQPPTIAITNLSEGQTFLAGTDIPIQASAADPDGSVSHVDFFVNGNPLSSDNSAPFEALLPAPRPGNFAVTAVATDNQGATASTTVNVVVLAGNIPPSVTITNPVDGQTFFTGTNILLEASASDPDGQVTEVDFYNNGAFIG